MTELSRRRLLRAAALLPASTALGAVAGCADPAAVLPLRPTVRVAVSWSAGELEAFRRVLAKLQPRDYSVAVVPYGDNIAAALDTGTTGRPDVVLLPRPGLVDDNLEDLEPLPEELREPWRYADIWDDLLFQRGRPYGLPFKIAHKSAVWYRTDVFAKHNLTPPRSWSQWRELNASLIRLDVTPLAVGGADGWVLTDFFENVLLGSAPGAYDELAARHCPDLWNSEAVRRALRLLGRMWGARGALAGGARRCLVLQFPDAVLEVFTYGRAAMVVAPDFAESVINRFATDPSTVGVFPFPAMDGDDQDVVPGPQAPPVVVGGDVAVLPKPSSDGARDLVRRLAEPDAPLPWINPDGGRDAGARRPGVRGGFIAAHPDTPLTEYSPELRELARQLDAVSRLRFDLSDQIGAVGSTQGLWRVLQDFLETVGDGGADRVPDEAETAARRLHDFEQRLIDERGRGERDG